MVLKIKRKEGGGGKQRRKEKRNSQDRVGVAVSL